MIWFFYERIAFSLTKNKWFAQKKIYFSYVLTVFPLFMPKSILLPSLFTKEWPSLFTKERCERFILFHEGIAFMLIRSQNMSNLLRKPMNEFLTLVFEPKSKKFSISPIAPKGTANNMQTHKFEEKFWNWPTVPFTVAYTLHKTLYSL